MKIVVDCRMINTSGIGRYVRGIISNNLSDYITILYNDNDEINWPINRKIKFNRGVYSIKEQINFPYNKIKDCELLHIPHYNVPLFYKGNLITTIHDVTPILFSKYNEKLNIKSYSKCLAKSIYIKFMIKNAIKKSRYILTVSNNTKIDLIKYFNIDPNKVIVTYLGVEEIFINKMKEEYDYLYDKYNISKNKKILLYIGNKKPHKNLYRLYKALDILNKNDEKYLLISIGKDFGEDTILKNKDIININYVDDNELVDFYNVADLFVFPSLYEGFGIPPLEAMSCGTPVVCSNISSIPEIVGNAAILFDPYDENSIANSIKMVINNEKIYDELIKQGYERVKNFTWTKFRYDIERIYNSILK